MEKTSFSRRRFIKSAAAAGAALCTLPNINCGKIGVRRPMKRVFGRIGFETTTLGLGGQASIQWTPDDVDPEKIILKAFDLGVNYFDTSNLYGPSQSNYGKVFRRLHLIPDTPGYDSRLRNSIFLTSKTHLRWAKGQPEKEGVMNWSNGGHTSCVDDLKRSLSQMFGDGKGNYPEGAYLNMVLIHSVSSMADVDAVYRGLDHPDEKDEVIGALAALRDYRDGTNLTGLNPGEEKLVRHLGFSGHFSPPVMMEMIQRDDGNILDGLLVAVNPNDKLHFNMQHNVLPVARAKDMGIIAMKVFADGAMYDKEPGWSYKPEHVVRRVGSENLPSRPLVEYSLCMPGVHTAIIGIGQISEEPGQCQLTQNLSAAQILPDALSSSRKQEIESMTARIREGRTNYFQTETEGLTPVQNPKIERIEGTMDQVRLTWQNAFADKTPIDYYEILRDGKEIGRVPHQPQISKTPFEYTAAASDSQDLVYQIVAVDEAGHKAAVEVALES